jgi:hypothetical protein
MNTIINIAIGFAIVVMGLYAYTAYILFVKGGIL